MHTFTPAYCKYRKKNDKRIKMLYTLYCFVFILEFGTFSVSQYSTVQYIAKFMKDNR